MDPVHVPQDELAAEQAASQLPKEEDVRAEIIAEFGFDAEADKDRIDKAVKREMENRKKLSTAIGQKINWRNQATRPPQTPTQTPTPTPTPTVTQEESLRTEDLYALMGAQVPQEDVGEVRKAAKLLGTDIAGALKDPIVQARLKTLKEQRASAAALNGGPSRPGAKALSGDEIVEEARKGNIPKPGTPEAEALYRARRPRAK